MPNQQHVPLPKEGMQRLEKQLIDGDYATDRALFPEKLNTSAFSASVKNRFDHHMDAFKAELGDAAFDKYCAVSFTCSYDNGMGVCDATEGRTGALMMLMGTIILRLTDSVQEAQRYLPQRDSVHKTVANLIKRLMEMTLVMVPDSGKDSSIILP